MNLTDNPIFLTQKRLTHRAGVLAAVLIAALIVIPVITALQLKKSFLKTILYAEAISLFSVISGIFVSFYINLSSGGTIVLIMLAIFTTVFAIKHG